MNITRLVNDIKKAEGEVRNERDLHIPYLDSKNILTIGWGTNIQHGITDQEAEMLFMNRLQESIQNAETLSYFNRLDEDRQNAVIEMIYQLGFNGFRGFIKMNKALGMGDYERAYVEALDSKWYRKDTPGRAKRIALAIKG